MKKDNDFFKKNKKNDYNIKLDKDSNTKKVTKKKTSNTVKNDKKDLKVKLNVFSNKYSTIIFSLILVVIFVVVLSGSYAFFTTMVKGKEFVIYTGTLVVNYSKKTDVINVDNLYPMTNTEGLNQIPHEFTVTNDGNINARYQVRLELDNSLKDMISTEYIKLSYSIDGSSYSEPVLLSNLNSNLVFLKDAKLAPTKSNTIGIKMWIDINAPNEIQGKTFKAKVVVDSIQDVDDGYVVNTVPIIYLNKDKNGNQDINLKVGNAYTELGVNRVEDDSDVIKTSQVTKTYEYYDGTNLSTVNSVDTSKTGIYYITYSVTDSNNNTGKTVRIITVNNTDTIPTITLNGESSINIIEDERYLEYGVTVENNNKVVTLGNVKTTAPGTYTIKYIVIDNNGNLNSIIRTVTVIEKYRELLLNGADPVLTDNLVPVQIADDGTVTKADITSEWYDYETKNWANAVVLKDNYDENTIYDLSGNNYDAILMNGLAVSKDENGRSALTFDGEDDYAILPTLPASTNWQDGLTIEFEATWNDFNTFSRIFEFGNNQTNTITVYNYGNVNNLTFNYLDNSYEHERIITEAIIQKNISANYKVVVRKTTTGYETNIYQNNNLVITNNTAGFMENIERTTNYLGKSNYDGDEYFKGKIYSLKITQADGKVVLWYNLSANQNEFISENEIIPEEAIESYFVWIPKYSYQLWDLGNYDSLTTIDSTKPHAIPIKFGLTNTKDSKAGECTTPGVAGESGNCKVGDYMTHPAFLAFDTNGLWVGKFETGYDGATSTSEAETDVDKVDTGKIIIKPNVYSWRGIEIGNIFKNSYDYLRSDESHMMKNTEWGAVAYLSHSLYGTCSGDECNEVRINNNNNYITGYASILDTSDLSYTTESTNIGVDGTHTVNYLNNLSISATTAGNKTGIYDMSGGSYEYIMAYNIMATTDGTSNIFNYYSDFLDNSDWYKYYDRYSSTSNLNYSNRILGDAMGELGPFEKNTDDNEYYSSWNYDHARINNANNPWFVRGGGVTTSGKYAGIFLFGFSVGSAKTSVSFRIVLAPTK